MASTSGTTWEQVHENFLSQDLNWSCAVIYLIIKIREGNDSPLFVIKHSSSTEEKALLMLTPLTTYAILACFLAWLFTPCLKKPLCYILIITLDLNVVSAANTCTELPVV